MDGFDVGYAVVELPPAQGRTYHTFEMRTAYRALVGELLGCGLMAPPPGIPGAQFRPGDRRSRAALDPDRALSRTARCYPP